MKYFFKSILIAAILGIAIYFDESIVVKIRNGEFNIHLLAIALVLIAIISFYNIITSVFKTIIAYVFNTPSPTKGIKYVENTLSAIILKNQTIAEKNLKKAKKHLGDIPIIGWLDGQLELVKNNPGKAKAIFYKLSAEEKDTALGAYSLCKISIDEKSSTDAINAINNILKISPKSYELIFEAIVISLQQNNFDNAKQYVKQIKNNSHKEKIVTAIIYHMEGMHKHDISLLQKAFYCAPELSENAWQYADMLMKNNNLETAAEILKKSIILQPSMDLYNKLIISIQNIKPRKQKNYAKKIVKNLPISWISHFGAGKIYENHQEYELAFQYYLKAYSFQKYDFIAEKLTSVIDMLQDPLPQEAIDTINSEIERVNVNIIWKCQKCSHEYVSWQPICDNCQWIAEIVNFEKTIQYDKLNAIDENKS